MASHIRAAHAGSLTIYGPDGPRTTITRDRPHPNENITDKIFRTSEMASRCSLFKIQSAADKQLIESIDSDVYSVSFPFSDGDCSFRYEGGIRIPWSCARDMYRECLKIVLETRIGHKLREVRYSDSVQIGAPAEFPLKLYFDFASFPGNESPCNLLVDGMANPSYEPGYIYFVMSVKLSMNCDDRVVE